MCIYFHRQASLCSNLEIRPGANEIIDIIYNPETDISYPSPKYNGNICMVMKY